MKCVRRGKTALNTYGATKRDWPAKETVSDENRRAVGALGVSLDGPSNARIFRDFRTGPEIIRLAIMMHVR